ncbi:MAG: DUF2807 domain-containing protein [Bacteroidales bacterium]|nr:DUF2807 domain-containing protein [Bacteroidales bacterium]
MRVINNVIVAAVLVLSLNSCFVRTNGLSSNVVFYHSDSTKVIDRVEEPFTSLEVSSGMDVQFIPSTEYRVVAEVPKNTQYLFSTAVYEDGKLMIKTDEASIIDVRTEKTRIEFRDFPPIKVYCPYLTAVKINGSGDFRADDLTVTGEFKAEIYGSGDIEIKNLVSDDCSLNIFGAGDIEVKNIDVHDLKASLFGAGDIDIAGKAESADLDIHGAGDIDIRNLNVSGNIKTECRGVGSVKMKK